MKERDIKNIKQKIFYANKIFKKENISKNFKKTKLNNNSKNIYKNKPKLRQNNILQNVNTNNDILRVKSKSIPSNKQIYMFGDTSREKAININHSYLNKQKNIFKNGGYIKSISNEKEIKFSADSRRKLFRTNEKTIKINLTKISKKEIDIPSTLNTNTNYENLKYIQLNDISSLFNAWQNSFVIYKSFEDKLLNKNNFEINKNTLEIITKNIDSSKQLNDQKFWILYIEYLINKNLLLNEKQFITLINEAFSHMNGGQFSLLKSYYIQKIKTYFPDISSTGTSDDNDEIYINKLDKSVINFIKSKKQQNILNSFTILKNRRISYSDKKEKEEEELNNKIVKNLYDVFNRIDVDLNNK